MRALVALVVLYIIAVPAACAQAAQGQGTVFMVLSTDRLELTPESRTGTAKAWINATVQCQSGYPPTTVTIRPEPQSLEDEEGEEIWSLSPSNIRLSFSEVGAGGQYEARLEEALEVRMLAEPRPSSTTIYFQLAHSSSLVSDCSPLGGSVWDFDREPELRVRMTTDGQGPTFSDDALPAVAPVEAPSAPSEIGRIGGTSRMPGEALGALAIFGGVVASYVAFEWRSLRRR